MTELHRTQEALAEFAALALDGFGTHLLPDAQTSINGLVLGQVDYDPRRDLPNSIVHNSVRELVTGQPQVSLVAPQQLLQTKVILHERASNDGFGIAEAKRNLALNLAQAIKESMPGMTDEVYTYAVGEEAAHRRDLIEVRSTDGSPLNDARVISELCQDGLSFVISDFLNLPLANMPTQRFPATVAVKTNHQIEIALPANVGTLPTIQGGEVNTNKTKELKRVNDALENMHSNIAERLQQAGIALAQIILRPKQPAGYDVTEVDRALGRALGQIKPF